jgi:hypothetical protein
MTSLLSPLPRGNSRSLLSCSRAPSCFRPSRHQLVLSHCAASIDEISQCSPHDVSKIVYSLANGVGTQRASRTGAARSVVQWTCAVLSSGERTITTELASAGIKPKAGQLVRLLDIQVDPARCPGDGAERRAGERVHEKETYQCAPHGPPQTDSRLCGAPTPQA